MSIKIDIDMCNSCKTCVDSCWVDVFRWDDKEDKPIAAYPEDCVWCFACERACPVKCIEVMPELPIRVPGTF
jgi:NAD-dependent dihydropyrimidine dehydrogenase PreA subunit